MVPASFVRGTLAAVVVSFAMVAPTQGEGNGLQPAAVSASAPSFGAGPALWKIEDADSVLWLFGSIHALPRGLDWRTPEMNAAFESADTLVLEADVDSDAAEATFERIIIQYGKMNVGETPLSQRLEPADRALLNASAARSGIPRAAIDWMRPWLAYLVLSGEETNAQGWLTSTGVEATLRRDALAAKMDEEHLATLRDHVRFMSGISEAGQLALLVDGLRQKDDTALMNGILAAWMAGKVDEIDALAGASMRRDTPEAYEAIIAQRNRNWAEWVEDRLGGQGTTFVAGGALHFAGPDSVITLLQRKGITVTRVPVSAPAPARPKPPSATVARRR
jgi:uncharacterized protein